MSKISKKANGTIFQKIYSDLFDFFKQHWVAILTIVLTFWGLKQSNEQFELSNSQVEQQIKMIEEERMSRNLENAPALIHNGRTTFYLQIDSIKSIGMEIENMGKRTAYKASFSSRVISYNNLNDLHNNLDTTYIIVNPIPPGLKSQHIFPFHIVKDTLFAIRIIHAYEDIATARMIIDTTYYSYKLPRDSKGNENLVAMENHLLIQFRKRIVNF